MTDEEDQTMIYHYTDIKGFKNIVESKCFWATKYNYLNDKNEIDFGIELIKDRLNHHGIETELSNEYFEDHFLLCFSRNPDSLNLWRNYSESTGVALGFNSDEILAELSGENNEFVGTWNDAIYKEEDIKNEIDEICRDYIKNQHKGKELQNLFGTLVAFSGIISVACSAKSCHFSIEEERRFSFFAGEPKTKFREKNGILIPYIELSFDIHSIKTVKICPTNNAPISVLGIKDFLKAKGLDIDPTPSDIPLQFY